VSLLYCTVKPPNSLEAFRTINTFGTITQSRLIYEDLGAVASASEALPDEVFTLLVFQSGTS
jgi:hypothetical protein